MNPAARVAMVWHGRVNPRGMQHSRTPWQCAPWRLCAAGLARLWREAIALCLGAAGGEEMLAGGGGGAGLRGLGGGLGEEGGRPVTHRTF